MPDSSRLRALLQRIDGRSFPAYRDLLGSWRMGEIVLIIDHVQGDPFAAPSRVRVRADTSISSALLQEPDARLAAEDWLLRRFAASLRSNRRGSGRSGELRIYQPGPEIVERSAVRLIADGWAEVRFSAGLPAQGRRIRGQQAWQLLSEDIPAAAEQLWIRDDTDLRAHVRAVQLQRHLRRQLRPRKLVSFIADGAVLPRESGVSQAPLPGAIPFLAPETLRLTLDGPDGPISGLGIPEGLTLIVGGGFHGKSTLLQAIQRGFLDHVPGDGRERVVSRSDVVKVRAEDGRRVEAVDVSAFLCALPGGRETAPFSTEDASGSTSQAAAIMEAVESGASVLLLDEDTSATNLLVRDARMRQLIPQEHEPITPFVERVRELYERWGVSTVMVLGGVGDYLAVSDTVIGMVRYRPQDLTARAKGLAGEVARPSAPLGDPPASRAVLLSSLVLTGKGRVRARDERRIDYGRAEIDLSSVEQVLDSAHAESLGHSLGWLSVTQEGTRPLSELLDILEAGFDQHGVELLSPFHEPSGNLVRPRRYEVAAALSRLRSFRSVSD